MTPESAAATESADASATTDERAATATAPAPPEATRKASRRLDPADLSFPGMVYAALAGAGRTGLGIARRIDRTWPGFLTRRQGFVYPALLELERQGKVTARWDDLPRGRRLIFERASAHSASAHSASSHSASKHSASKQAGASGAPRGEETVAASPSRRRPFPAGRLETIALSDELRETAARCAGDLRFAPHLEERMRMAVWHHLLDVAAGHVGDGKTLEQARAAAVRNLGDAWRIRTDLGRTARGKPTVAFPRTLVESLHGLAIYDLRVLMLIAAAILFVRLQWLNPYHIPTKSMEPTLHGDVKSGDHILVNRLAGPPERFDIVVFDGWGAERKHYVKRVVGLPNERLQFREGDLYVDGVLIRKEGENLDALLFPMFDIDRERDHIADNPGTQKSALFGARLMSLWTPPVGTAPWQLAQWQGEFRTTVEADAAPAELHWGNVIEDELYDRKTLELHGGIYPVADVRLTTAVRPTSGGTQVSLRLLRGDQTFEAVVVDEGRGVSLLIDGIEVARRADLILPLGETTDVRFSHVDHVLRLDVDGEPALRHDLPQPAQPKRTGPSGRVMVVVSKGSVGITPLRLERDVHWNAEYDGIDARDPGEGEYFVAGDNSNNSQDSRARGPIHGNRIVGKPLLVVWPFSRVHIPR